MKRLFVGVLLLAVGFASMGATLTQKNRDMMVQGGIKRAMEIGVVDTFSWVGAAAVTTDSLIFESRWQEPRVNPMAILHKDRIVTAVADSSAIYVEWLCSPPEALNDVWAASFVNIRVWTGASPGAVNWSQDSSETGTLGEIDFVSGGTLPHFQYPAATIWAFPEMVDPDASTNGRGEAKIGMPIYGVRLRVHFDPGTIQGSSALAMHCIFGN